MTPYRTLSSVVVEETVFPPSVKPPATDKHFFLAGAGVRGLTIEGKFISFTAIGVYLEDDAVAALSDKWKGKTADELAESVDFFRDIVTGPFEKFTHVTMLKPLTGAQYSEKVTENCIAIWKALGIYTVAEEKATTKFTEVFKDQTFPPGHSILFKQSPAGSLTIAFGKHDSIPDQGVAVIENKNMAQAVLESIIGKHGVSPDAKRNLAERIWALLNAEPKPNDAWHTSPTISKVIVENIVFPPSVKPPVANKPFFLGGAGVRGLMIEGNFISFTAIGVYLDEEAVPALSGKWKGKTAAELVDSVEFFRDVVTGAFEKFTQVTMLKPLTGAQYSEKVTENCIAIWKALGIYTAAEERATQKFTEVFKDQSFPPGHSILFKQTPDGSLTIAFGKHDSIPEEGVAVIENKNMSEAVLESIIGKHGVSPDAKKNLAERISALLK